MKHVHTGDFHIGLNSFKKQENEIIKNINIIKDYCIINNGKLFINGDEFDGNKPSNHLRGIFYKFLSELESSFVETYIISGNHDNIGENNALEPLKAINWKYVKIITDIQSINIDGLNYIFVPHLTTNQIGNVPDIEEWISEKILENIKSDKNILVTHAHFIGGIIGAEQKVLRGGINYLKELKKEKFLKCFSGHLHQHQELQKGLVHYSGSVTINDFGERKDEKGFLVYDTEKNEVTFEKLECKEWKQITFDFVDKRTIILEEENLLKYKNNILKLIFNISEENLKLVDTHLIVDKFSQYGEVIKIEKNIIRTGRIKLDKSELKDLSPDQLIKNYISDNYKEDKTNLTKKSLEILTEVQK
jgi:DNA repair exonuclease SbcCD nuclease subunit